MILELSLGTITELRVLFPEHSAHVGRDPRRRPLRGLLRGAGETPQPAQV